MSKYNHSKHYSDDWAKSKSREVSRDMISRCLLPIVPAARLKVLCLPGRDLEELHEVYDPIGIKRENITGIELLENIADEIEAQKSGIKLIRKSIEQYAEENQHFDFNVVSIDYTNPISNSQIATLARIMQYNPNNHVVIHHANLGKRDSRSSSLYVYAQTSLNDGNEILRTGADALQATHEQAKRVNDLNLKFDDDAKKMKRTAYGKVIHSGYSGSTDESVAKVLRFVYGKDYESLLDEMRRCCERIHSVKLKRDEILNWTVKILLD